MTVPEGIPEDRQESYQCPECEGDLMVIDGIWQCNRCGWTPEADKKVERLIRQIISADKTPEYGYSSSDPQTYLNRAGNRPPVGERWMSPREICEEYLRGNYD